MATIPKILKSVGIIILELYLIVDPIFSIKNSADLQFIWVIFYQPIIFRSETRWISIVSIEVESLSRSERVELNFPNCGNLI